MTDEERMGFAMVEGEMKVYKRGYTIDERTPWAWGSKKRASMDIKDVHNVELSDYVNDPETRKALHIPASTQAWQMCGGADYHMQQEASLWIYPIMKQNGIKILFYSGDTDSAVPLGGTRKWIARLDWKVLDAWRPWFTNNNVSGFIEQYEGLDFVTVKGVGHLAPQWARQPVQEMITAWMNSKAI